MLANDTLLRGNVISTGGGHPVFPAYDPFTGLLYTSDTAAGNLLVLDPQNNTYRAPIHLGGSPDAIGVDPLNQLLYVTNTLGDSVSVVNATSGTIVANITVGLAPSAVVFDPNNDAMLVTDAKSDQISTINASVNRLVGNVTGWDGPFGIAFDAADGHVYVTNHNDPNNLDSWNCTGTASVYNSSGSVAFLYNVSVGWDPSGIAYDPSNRDLYVANGFGCGVTVIDGRNDTPIGYIPAGAAEEGGILTPYGVAVDPKSNHIFVTVQEYYSGLYGIVLMINGSQNRITSLNLVDGQIGWIADDPQLGRVYAADYRAMDVIVLAASSDALLSDDLTGTVPGAMVFNPVTREVYVTDPNASIVLAVNTTTDRVQRSIQVGPGAHGIAVDSNTGNVVVSETVEAALVEIDATTGLARRLATDQEFGFYGDQPTALLFTATDQLLQAENFGSCPSAGGGNVGQEQVPAPQSCVDVRSPQSGADERFIHIWGEPDGTSIASDPVRSTYYFPVTNNNGTALDVLNGRTLNWTHQIQVGTNDRGRDYQAGVGNDTVLYDTGNNRIYFADCGGSQVTILNATTYAFLANVTMPTPSALAYDSNDGLVIAASQNGSIAVLNGTTNAVVASIRVGGNPDGLAYDPFSDQLFVANNGSGTLSILNLSIGPRPPSPMATLSENTTAVRAGVPVTFTFNLAGGPAGAHYEYGLPPGCVSSDEAVLVCTPSVPGTYWVTAAAYDDWGRSWTPNPVVLTVTRWLYPVVFSETGLPPGTPWGIEATFGLENSTSPSIRVLLPNSTGVGFYVATVAGYSSSPLGEQLFDVSGAGLSIAIEFAPIPGPLTVLSFAATPTPYRVGSALTLKVQAGGGSAPYRYSYSNLPQGCNSVNDSILDCTPTKAGDFLVSVAVSDQSGQSTSATISLVIAPVGVSRANPQGPLGSFLGLSLSEQLALLGGAAAVGLGLAGLFVIRRRRRPPPTSDGPPSSGDK